MKIKNVYLNEYSIYHDLTINLKEDPNLIKDNL